MDPGAFTGRCDCGVFNITEARNSSLEESRHRRSFLSLTALEVLPFLVADAYTVSILKTARYSLNARASCRLTILYARGRVSCLLPRACDPARGNTQTTCCAMADPSG